MMANKQYRRLEDDKFPFTDGKRSGSNWDEQHLRWLEISHFPACPADEVLPFVVKETSRVSRQSHSKLGKEWETIERIQRFAPEEKV